MLPFAFIFMAGILANIILMPIVTYSGVQKYRDVIYGPVEFNTNKTGELILFRVLLLIMTALIIFSARFVKYTRDAEEAEFKCGSYALFCCIALNVGYYFLMGGFNGKIAVASIFYLTASLLYAEKAKNVLLLGICSYYTVTAYVALTVFLTQATENVWWKKLDQPGIFMLTLALVAIIMMVCRQKGEIRLKKLILAEQIVIPFNFLIYDKTLYKYGENWYSISHPSIYAFIIFLACGCGIGLAVRHFMKADTEGDWGSLIGLSTVAVIFSINSYITPANIVPSNFWHHGEQITAWHQFSDLGQKLYSDFCPSSGLFSIPLGLLTDLFGGNATSYAAAYSLIAMCVAIVTAVLCIMLADKKLALLIAVGTGTFVYNRGILILPYLLLLTLPKLVENRSAWLKTWIISSMICGLYYPSIGVALLVATMPFGILQLIRFFKLGEWGQKRRNIIFWATWTLVLACILANAEILANMALYILNLSGQSMEANSTILLLYTVCPEYFMPLLPDGIRYVIYLFVRVLLAAIMVVLPISLLGFFIKKHGKEFLGSMMGMALLSSGIFLLLYQSYSLLVVEKDFLIARTSVGIFATAVYLLVVLYRYGEKCMTRKLNNILSSILFTMAVMMFVCGISSMECVNVDLGVPTGGTVDDALRFVSAYDVNADDYVYTPDAGNEAEDWIGEGFINIDHYNRLAYEKQFIEQYGLQDEYFVNMDRFDYFLLNIKAAYVETTGLLQSKKAQDGMINAMKDKRPIVLGYTPAGDYEFIKWLQQNDYKQINGWYASSQTIKEHGMEGLVVADRIYTRYSDYGRYANAFGKSFKSLEKEFDRKKDFSGRCEVVTGNDPQDGSRAMRISFPEKVNGTEYDYLYIDLNSGIDFKKEYAGSFDEKIQAYYGWNKKQDEKKATIYWKDAGGNYTDEYSCSMLLQTGELFIPIGYNSSWKDLTHSEIWVKLSGNFDEDMEIRPESVCVLGR